MKYTVAFLVAQAMVNEMDFLEEYPESNDLPKEDLQPFLEGWARAVKDRITAIIESECAELIEEKDAKRLFGYLRGRGIGLKSLGRMCDTMIALENGEINPRTETPEKERKKFPMIWEAFKDIQPFS